MFKNQLSKIRYSILESCHRIKEGHIGSAFSVVEILFVIFKKYFKKNYFILSKGHAAIGTYAVMNHFGILKNKDYQSFCGFNSKLGGHPDSTKLPNFNFSTFFKSSKSNFFLFANISFLYLSDFNFLKTALPTNPLCPAIKIFELLLIIRTYYNIFMCN